MATSSILGGEKADPRAEGRDDDALGPSDSSDSASDIQGERRMPTREDNPGELGATPARRDSSTDSRGTGERASAEATDAPDANDIAPDRVESDGEADTPD